MVRLNFCLALIFTFLFSYCKSQTDNEKIFSTSFKVVEAIQNLDTIKFKSLIGVDDLKIIGKNEEMIDYDVQKYKKLFQEYLGNRKPIIEITELYNTLGQKLVKIRLHSNTENKNRISEMHIDLLFGPPNINSLDKISGYELVKNNSDSIEFRPWPR